MIAAHAAHLFYSCAAFHTFTVPVLMPGRGSGLGEGGSGGGGLASGDFEFNKKVPEQSLSV